MKNQNSDPGIKAVGKIFRDLKIDTEWSQVFERGFVWWGHHFAQKVWADEPFEEDGLLISKVQAEMDFFKYPESPSEVETLLSREMIFASMAGPVICQETQTVKLYCSAFFHEENQAWLSYPFSLALLLQNYMVEFKAHKLAPTLDYETVKSQAPIQGLRR